MALSLLSWLARKIPPEEERSMSVTFKALENILEHYPPSSEHLISALQDVQAKFNYLPPEAMTAVCDHLGVPLSRGWAVATFYKAFSLEPKENMTWPCAWERPATCGGRPTFMKNSGGTWELPDRKAPPGTSSFLSARCVVWAVAPWRLWPRWMKRFTATQPAEGRTLLRNYQEVAAGR
jgi:hypothetical protein